MVVFFQLFWKCEIVPISKSERLGSLRTSSWPFGSKGPDGPKWASSWAGEAEVSEVQLQGLACACSPQLCALLPSHWGQLSRPSLLETFPHNLLSEAPLSAGSHTSPDSWQFSGISQRILSRVMITIS